VDAVAEVLETGSINQLDPEAELESAELLYYGSIAL
jgi:hypothetical protein